jgi:TPR repeat protein
MYYLGLLYAHGRGQAPDFTAALAMFEGASRLQHAPSMYYLGIMSANGHGVPVDYDLAIHWFEQAAGSTDPVLAAKANNAAVTLRQAVEAAQERNDEVYNSYKNKIEETQQDYKFSSGSGMM